MLDEQKFLGNVPPAGEQLTRLEFLNCVIKESMRVLPPVPYTVRATESEVWLGPYYLPHGARVILSHYLTHHLPELYSGRKNSGQNAGARSIRISANTCLSTPAGYLHRGGFRDPGAKNGANEKYATLPF